MKRPTLQQHERIQRDHAERYAEIERSAEHDVQRLNVLLGRPVTVPLSLRDVMDASERVAHFSRGYTPEQPSEAEELRPMDRLILALWMAFGIGAAATVLYFAMAPQS